VGHAFAADPTRFHASDDEVGEVDERRIHPQRRRAATTEDSAFERPEEEGRPRQARRQDDQQGDADAEDDAADDPSTLDRRVGAFGDVRSRES
jgi:hypothetical protein